MNENKMVVPSFQKTDTNSPFKDTNNNNYNNNYNNVESNSVLEELKKKKINHISSDTLFKNDQAYYLVVS